MGERIVIYPLSADPLTLGHVDIIERAVSIFPSRTLHVVIASNRTKKHLFTIEERMAIAEASVKHLDGKIKIVEYPGIISDYVNEHGVEVIVRGIRNGVDFDYEIALEQFTRNTTSAETVYLSPKTAHLNTSSSLVRMFIESGNIAEAKNFMSKDGYYKMGEIIKQKDVKND